MMHCTFPAFILQQAARTARLRADQRRLVRQRAFVCWRFGALASCRFRTIQLGRQPGQRRRATPAGRRVRSRRNCRRPPPRPLFPVSPAPERRTRRSHGPSLASRTLCAVVTSQRAPANSSSACRSCSLMARQSCPSIRTCHAQWCGDSSFGCSSTGTADRAAPINSSTCRRARLSSTRSVISSESGSAGTAPGQRVSACARCRA